MRQSISIPLARRLIFLTILLEISVIVFAFLTLSHSKRQYEERAAVETENMAKLLAHDLTSVFDKVDLMLLGIKEEAERQMAASRLDHGQLDLFVKRELSRLPEVRLVEVSDAGGQVSYVSGLGISDKKPSIARREHFLWLKSHEENELFISKPFVGQITGKKSILFARRLDSGRGNFAGVIHVSITLDQFQKLFSTLHVGSHGVVHLGDADLNTVLRHPEIKDGDLDAAKAMQFSWQRQLSSSPDHGSFVATGMDQRTRLHSYHKAGLYPLYILVGQYPEDSLGGWYEEVRNTLAMILISGVVIAVSIWIIIRSVRQHEADARRMKDLSLYLIEVQESERKKLALELHDMTSPNLAALQMSMRIMETGLTADDKRKLELGFMEMRSIIGDVTENLRDICANLRPSMLDYCGLLAALNDYADNCARTMSAELKVSGERFDVRLAPEIESVLFRIAQEAVTNAVKHANASAIEIHLRHENGRTTMSVSDDGVGFDPAQLGSDGRPGLGLLTMRERAEFAGGRFSLRSHPGDGTRILVEL